MRTSESEETAFRKTSSTAACSSSLLKVSLAPCFVSSRAYISHSLRAQHAGACWAHEETLSTKILCMPAAPVPAPLCSLCRSAGINSAQEAISVRMKPLPARS